MTKEIKEIQAKIKLLEAEINELIPQKRKLQDKHNDLSERIGNLKIKIKYLKMDYYKQNLIVTDIHRNLLRRLSIFGNLELNDAIIGIDWKRPFGSSFVDNDIAEVIGFEKGDDGYTDEQVEQMNQIIEELPFALKIVLGQI